MPVGYSLRFRPELVEDVRQVFDYYEAAATGLGHEFLRAYFVAVASVQREPLLHQRVHSTFRRVLLQRFPYALYFLVQRKEVIVFLLVHGARDPVGVKRMLRSRKRN